MTPEVEDEIKRISQETGQSVSTVINDLLRKELGKAKPPVPKAESL